MIKIHDIIYTFCHELIYPSIHFEPWMLIIGIFFLMAARVSDVNSDEEYEKRKKQC